MGETDPTPAEPVFAERPTEFIVRDAFTLGIAPLTLAGVCGVLGWTSLPCGVPCDAHDEARAKIAAAGAGVLLYLAQEGRGIGLKNKLKAMSVLRSRVLAREVQRQHEQVSDARRSQIGSGDRSEKVRTYNYPQTRVTDHRVGVTSHNLEEVLDGDIDLFIDALVEREQALNLEEASL